MSAAGAKESYAATRLMQTYCKTTAVGRGQVLSPLRGSIRTRLRRDMTLKLRNNVEGFAVFEGLDVANSRQEDPFACFDAVESNVRCDYDVVMSQQHEIPEGGP